MCRRCSWSTCCWGGSADIGRCVHMPRLERFCEAARGAGCGGGRPGFFVGGHACGVTPLRCSQRGAAAELATRLRRCAQTAAASQSTKRATRAHLAAALLGANKAPGQPPSHPCFAPLMACERPWHAKACSLRQANAGKGQHPPHAESGAPRAEGASGRAPCWRRRRAGKDRLPLAMGQGMASMFEARRAESRSHLSWTSTRRAVTPKA